LLHLLVAFAKGQWRSRSVEFRMSQRHACMRIRRAVDEATMLGASGAISTRSQGTRYAGRCMFAASVSFQCEPTASLNPKSRSMGEVGTKACRRVQRKNWRQDLANPLRAYPNPASADELAAETRDVECTHAAAHMEYWTKRLLPHPHHASSYVYLGAVADGLIRGVVVKAHFLLQRQLGPSRKNAKKKSIKRSTS